MRDLKTVSIDEVKKLLKVCNIINKIKEIDMDTRYVFVRFESNPSCSGSICLDFDDFHERGKGKEFVKWCLYYGFDEQIDWNNI